MEEMTKVSIHAPAKGATWSWVHEVVPHQFVSIHAPAKGATLQADRKL